MTPRQPLLPALICTLVGFAVMVMPAGLVWNPSPDAIEYLDAARHLAAGDGLVTSLKAWHLHAPGEAPPQPEPLGATRSPLLAILITPALAVLPHSPEDTTPSPLVQLVPAFAAALAAGAALLLAARQGAPPLATWLAGLGVALLPALGGAARHLWAEPLAALCSLAALAFMASTQHSRRNAIAAGFMAGLAALARPEGLLVLPVALLFTASLESHRLRQATALLAGWLGAQLPWWLWTGSCLPPQSFLFSVHSFHELSWYGYQDPPTSGGSVLFSDPDFAIRGALVNLWANLRACLSPRHAGLLLPLAALAIVPGSPSNEQQPPDNGPLRRLWPSLLLAGLWLLALSAAAATRDPRRFTCVPLTLITPAAAWGLARLPMLISTRLLGRTDGVIVQPLSGIVAVTILAIHLGATGGRFISWNADALDRSRAGHFLSARPRDAWSHPDLDLVINADPVTPRSPSTPTIMAASFPWALSLRTSRPCVLLPLALDDDLLLRLVDEFGITTLVLDREASKKRSAELVEPLHYEQALAKAGRLAAVRNAGTYRVLRLTARKP